MISPLKHALEDLLRDQRLFTEPLRVGAHGAHRLSFGVLDLDTLLLGGLPRGHVSEIHGPRASGRTGLALGLAAQATREGALVAWVDPVDAFDPASADAAGLDLRRLLWVRGEGAGLRRPVAAAGVLADSGLFELLVLDLADIVSREMRRLPTATWRRLERAVEGTPAALVLLAGGHVFRGPGGCSLALRPSGVLWSGSPGPGHLLRGLGTEVTAWGGTQAARSTTLELLTCR
jgi:hypothetical protein